MIDELRKLQARQRLVADMFNAASPAERHGLLEELRQLGAELEDIFKRHARPIPAVRKFIAPPPRPGLGDMAERFFAAIGITEERYKSAKEKLRLDPNCGCSERKKWLNRMGEELGVDSLIAKFGEWRKKTT